MKETFRLLFLSIALLPFLSTSAQTSAAKVASACDTLFSTDTDRMSGTTHVRLRKPLLACSDSSKKTAMILSLHRADKNRADLTILLHGEVCVTRNTPGIFLFTDGTRLTIYSSLGANCEGIVQFNFLTRAQQDHFKTRLLAAVRVPTHPFSYNEQSVALEMAETFQAAARCLYP